MLGAGHGTLTYNLCGQTDSRFSADIRFETDLIVSDAVKLPAEVRLARPVLMEALWATVVKNRKSL